MNFFNRVLVIIGILLVMLVSAIAILLPAMVPGFLSEVVAAQAMQMHEEMNAMNPAFRIMVGALVSGVIWVIGLLLLWLEIKPSGGKVIKAGKIEGGETRVSLLSIRRRISYNVDQLEDVIKVKPRIKSGRGGLDVTLEVMTSPDINVPQKSAQVQSMVREIVEERMGLTLKSIKVVIHHASYGRKKKPPKKSEPAAPPFSPGSSASSTSSTSPASPVVAVAAAPMEEKARAEKEEKEGEEGKKTEDETRQQD